MAFVTTETAAVSGGGSFPALVEITGTYTSSGGGTGGVIAPGYTNSSGSFTAVTAGLSTGCLKIFYVTLTPTTEDATTPKAIVSYDSTLDRDIVTVTSVANATGTYLLKCYNTGA
jgi:hypothetical protein